MEILAVYLDLLRDCYDRAGKKEKVVARQKCGEAPYEIAMRFAGCNLSCGLCFASRYSWPDRFLKAKNVTDKKRLEDATSDFKQIPPPQNRSAYNWFRVLGGEPFLNDEYTEFLLKLLLEISSIDSTKFNNGIIIQTNGIQLGKGNTDLIRTYLQQLCDQNPSVIVAIETSIKGTNPEEFKLLTRTQSDELFSWNINSYFNLNRLRLPNLRPMIVAGFGVNESFLLKGESSKFRMTIISRENLPCFHPSLWDDDFRRLYEDFTNRSRTLDPMFAKMPMYGIGDAFYKGWVRPSIDQGKRIYGDRFYDSGDAIQRNNELEDSFKEISQRFFLVDNQSYYSAMIQPSPRNKIA